MNKKLLSGIMSGLMLASSCSAVGAEAPKGIKDRIINSVVKHKKLILTGAAIQAVADGALIWLLTHNNNIKMDYNKFENFDNFFGNFKKAAEACRKSLTVSNIKVRDARDLESKINNEATDKKTEETEEIAIEGINGLGDDVQGTLVLKKVKKEDGNLDITFEFKENEKAEERKEEKKEENESQETEVNEDKNESQEPKVNEDKKENQGTKENKNQEENESQETEVNENQEEKDKEDNSEKDSDEE